MSNMRSSKVVNGRLKQEEARQSSFRPEVSAINSSFDAQNAGSLNTSMQKKGCHRRVRTHTNEDFIELFKNTGDGGLNQIKSSYHEINSSIGSNCKILNFPSADICSQQNDKLLQQQCYKETVKSPADQVSINSVTQPVSHLVSIQNVNFNNEEPFLFNPQLQNNIQPFLKGHNFSKQNLNKYRSIASTAASSQVAQVIAGDEQKYMMEYHFNNESQVSLNFNTCQQTSDKSSNTMSYQYALQSAKEQISNSQQSTIDRDKDGDYKSDYRLSPHVQKNVFEQIQVKLSVPKDRIQLSTISDSKHVNLQKHPSLQNRTSNIVNRNSQLLTQQDSSFSKQIPKQTLILQKSSDNQSRNNSAFVQNSKTKQTSLSKANIIPRDCIILKASKISPSLSNQQKPTLASGQLLAAQRIRTFKPTYDQSNVQKKDCK